MHKLAYFTVSAIVLFALGLISLEAEGQSQGGSCLAAGLCCQGKNLSCHVSNQGGGQRKEEKEATKDSKRSMCFCDSACLELNDCCHDYSSACRKIDCVVSDDWTDWSECDVRCGPGVKTRTRRILQHPLNGGKACPITRERLACEGTACKLARASGEQEELRETGKIIPASFGDWRSDVKYNPFKDIRRNLYEKYHSTDHKIDRAAYCMTFEFTEVWSACHSADNSEASQLMKGNTVCVECQPQAMRKNIGTRCRGHGVLERETRWNAVLAPGCHGKWVLKSRKEDCKCHSGADSDFILL